MPNAASLWEAFQRQEGVKPRAVRRFTDRQDFRQAYYALVGRAIEDKFEGYYIMNYYGLGGAGKSSLLRRLEEELLGDGELPEDEARAACLAAREKLSRRRKAVVLRADFDDAALNSPEDVLLRFRAQLMRQNDKAFFPLFDMAMLRLSQKYGRRLPPDEEKELVTDNPVISFALDVVGDLTGVGLLIGAAQTAAKVGQGVARTLAGRKNAIRKANAEMSRMDVPDLERRLPYYFAMDVNAMDLPLVCVYLDTYEKMTARAEGVGRSTGFDEEWLKGNRGLVRNLGSAVFVIAGREQLRWTDLPFEERYIEALSQADSVDFLTSCGIEDSELCAGLYRLTGGEPIYLDLCVDEYERLTDPDRGDRKAPGDLTVKDFGENRDRLVERHTRYIPSNLRDALYLLAAMGRWSDAVCEELSRTLPIPSPAGTEYYQLTHLSYVRQEQESWVMHRPVAEVLAKELRPDLRERLVSALLKLAEEDPAALDILERMAQTVPDRRTAQAMEKQAGADCDAGRYPEARRRQERSVALWKALGSGCTVEYGKSLAALADILRAQLKNRPTAPSQSGGEAGGALQVQQGWQYLKEFCQEAILTCEGLGNGQDRTLARLWERKANGEDMLSEWDGAISSWERTLELNRELGEPEAVWRSDQLQIGWDHRLAGRLEEARTVLEDTLSGLAALDREAGRAYSPKTLLCAELLCQSYDGLNIETLGQWDEQLAQVQKWLRSLDYAVTGEEPLEELLDWQDWVDVSHSTFWFHSGVGTEGADVPERLRRAANLDRQVIAGLVRHLGELHPTVLNSKRTLVNIYLNRENAKGIGAVIDMDVLIQRMEDDQQTLGRVPKRNECYFPDPETVLATCRELVELYIMAMGREYPGTCEAKDLLVYAYESAGRPEDAIPLRQELWSYYSSAYGEGNREALRQNYLLIEDNRRTGRWSEAIALQTRRLERARAGESEDLSFERDRLCTLYLSRLWQDEELSQDQAREYLAELLALTEEFKPLNRKRYLDSAWQWCEEYAEDGLDEAVIDVALALADSLGSSGSREYEVIELLEPYAEEDTLSAARRCGVLLRLGRAYRNIRGGKERSAELLEELTKLLEAHPEIRDPDLGTALLELGLSRKKLVTDDRFRQAALEMLEAFRGALAWREEHLPPEDPATDAARFELAQNLAWVGKRKEAVPLLETVLRTRRNTLGETARETVEAELELVKALARTEGRYEEARSLFQLAQAHMEGIRFPPYTFAARYALYRGAGGELSYMEWEEAGEPEQ